MTLLIKKKIIVIKKRRQTTNTSIVVVSTKTTSSTNIVDSIIESKWQKRQQRHDNDIDFVYRDDFIYYQKNDKKKLCLFFNLKTKIFRIIYDEINHVDFYRCYQRIVETFYFHKLIKRLRVYIRKYHVCQLNQIKRHVFYDELIFIKTISTFFHTLIFDFILVLFKCQKYDYMLIMICKFFKSVDLLFDKTIYDVVEWAILILAWLLIVDWDLSRVIIFDKNSKFVSNFWQEIFKSLSIKILIIIVYYSQTNEQFERTNQTIEIVLRYLISKIFDVNWVIVVFSFQFEFNNASNTFIDQTSNKLKFEFFSRDLITSLTNNIINWSTNLNLLRLIYRKKAIDVMSFVNAQIKFRYDNKHKSLMLKIDDMIYLRLHKNYNLFSKFDKKFFN